MPRPDSESLRCFFEPKSIAVIGASRTPGRPGHTLVENLRKAFAGRIYPINKEAGEIAGLPAFTSVADVPGEVDLAVVLVPAESVTPAVLSCAAKGVRGVIVEAADFAEIGPEGRQRQMRIAEIARNAGMRLWGPNCLGVIDTRSGVITTYQPLRDVVPGHTSLITQSGALAGAVLAQVHEARTFAFNKVCSIGNKADVDECDLLEYLAGDPTTRVIGMYLESINDGRRFFELARRLTRDKPVIVLKSGRTPLGVAASLSHTASLAGDDRVVEAAFAQAGIVRVGDIGEFLSVMKAFDRLHERRAGKRVAIVCTTGAGGVLAADQLGLHGLELAHLSKVTMARLHEQFPAWLEPNQPLDISPTMMKIGPNRALQHAAAAVLEDDNVDALLLQTFGLPATASFDAAALAGLVAGKGKAAVAWLYGVRAYLEPWTVALEAGGLPVLPDLRSAARALQALASRASSAEQHSIAADSTPGPVREPAPAVESPPDTADAFALLRRYGIPAARGIQAANAEAAVSAAQLIAGPVAVKLADMRIAHKSEVGGVRLNLRTADEVRAAASAMGGPLYVQEMLAPGVELIISARRDPQFGPVVICGLGGLWVEILGDVAIRLAPIDEDDAARMLRELKAFPLLAGARGQKARDTMLLARAVVGLSQCIAENPAIATIEVNPFILWEDGGGAVDVVIEMTQTKSEREELCLHG
jgi:acetate---CoA ligase (ADP-forming)